MLCKLLKLYVRIQFYKNIHNYRNCKTQYYNIIEADIDLIFFYFFLQTEIQ